MAQHLKIAGPDSGESICTPTDKPRATELESPAATEPPANSEVTLDATSVAALRSLFELLDEWDLKENTEENTDEE